MDEHPSSSSWCDCVRNPSRVWIRLPVGFDECLLSRICRTLYGERIWSWVDAQQRGIGFVIVVVLNCLFVDMNGITAVFFKALSSPLLWKEAWVRKRLIFGPYLQRLISLLSLLSLRSSAPSRTSPSWSARRSASTLRSAYLRPMLFRTAWWIRKCVLRWCYLQLHPGEGKVPCGVQRLHKVPGRTQHASGGLPQNAEEVHGLLEQEAWNGGEEGIK